MEEGGDLARKFFLFRQSFSFPVSEGFRDLTILQSGISGKQMEIFMRVANYPTIIHHNISKTTKPKQQAAHNQPESQFHDANESCKGSQNQQVFP